MTEFTIKLEDADAASAVFTLRSNYKGGAPEAYRLIADQIEEQAKPAVEEPAEFGSIVRAGRGGSDRVLWQHAQQTHYWLSETGIEDVWSELTDVKVLRVGVTDPSSTPLIDNYLEGREDFADLLRREIGVLRAAAIDAVRMDAYDKVLARITALVGDS